jgi:hypothetical protein
MGRGCQAQVKATFTVKKLNRGRLCDMNGMRMKYGVLVRKSAGKTSLCHLYGGEYLGQIFWHWRECWIELRRNRFQWRDFEITLNILLLPRGS